MPFHNIYIRISPRSIAFLKFILEGYDGIATVTTIDKADGLVRLLVPAGRHDELWPVLADIAGRCRHGAHIQPLPARENP